MISTSTLFLASLLAVVVNAQAPPVQFQSSVSSLAANGEQGCLSASSNADGAPVVLHNCNTEATENHSWTATLFDRQNGPPGPITVFGNKCLDLTNGVQTNGNKLQVWTCGTGNPNQQWVATNAFTLQLNGTNKCVDLTGGAFNDGNPIQIWDCTSNNPNQAWQAEPVPNTVTKAENIIGGSSAAGAGGPFCVVAEAPTAGSKVVLAPCGNFTSTFATGNATWTSAVQPVTGPIKTFGGEFCLDVTGGSTANGTPLQIWNCVDGNTNQMFQVNSPNHITWAGKAKCLDLTGGSDATGTPIQIWDCIDGNTNQNWFLSQLD